MSLEGMKFSKKFKLRTDLFHHTHEVWGPCSYKNIPSRRRGPRVLDCYCGFHLFQRHFSTLGHFHPTIRLQRQAPKTHQNDTKTLSLAITGKRLVRSALARKLPKVVREKPREERAGHALRLVPREQYNIERPPTTKVKQQARHFWVGDRIQRRRIDPNH